MNDIQDFDNLTISLASPKQIRDWSYGEVKKPETINYRTLRPEKDGLFCERIFGTTKEWECYCGKFKSIRYKGVICDRCGVEVTHFRVRRERMGHIELAAPVSHIWYYRSVPSRIGLLLDLTLASLRSILYYEKYIVIESGDTDLKKMQLLSEEEYAEALERYGSSSFSVDIGAEAIRTLLREIDLDSLVLELRKKMAEKRIRSDKRLLKRIEIIEKLRRSDNEAEWMILDVIPVIPPELRPMVQLDGGRFATSDLNDLYRRVINRNNRLKRLMSLNAPDIIIRNEKRMLQEAVDALFDNSRRKKVVKGSSNRPLKSLSDLLKGKQGRFRQNLLGKRVDYSGRSVIVVGPHLKLNQCGLPKKMALELYKPFIMQRLQKAGIVQNIKKAKILVDEEDPHVWGILDEVIKEHPVLLNRAPTLHRLGIQAFDPVLVEGKAIRLHPLVCHAFNADFDGDQMAVHIPLTQGAQIECWSLMLSSKNLMNPANGEPIVFPSQDIVLGLYFLTKARKGVKGEGKHFSGPEEALISTELGYTSYHALCKIRVKGEWIETTPGRIIFNGGLPEGVDYINETLDDGTLREVIKETHRKHGAHTVVQILDSVKELGFRYATLFGCSIGMDDIIIPKEKKKFITEANDRVSQIQKQYRKGHITNEERYNRVVEVWSKTNDNLTDVMMADLEKDKDGFNNVYMMASSGARGSRNQIRQLAGMRGLMAKPSGDIIELPIRSNFKEGLSVIEFFISSNGARKGLADMALKTADAGYLTRRLVDIAQDVVINEEDCGTINGIEMTALKDGEDIIEPLSDRIVGHYTLERIRDPITNEVIIDADEEIMENTAKHLEEIGIESIKVRTVLTCESQYGICCRCYGRDLTTQKKVNIGEAVGIIAAQSIGQPGTQLTMRTFHVGGTASTVTEGDKITQKYPVLIRNIRGNYVELDNSQRLMTRKGYLDTVRIYQEIPLKGKEEILTEDGKRVRKGQVICRKDDKNKTEITAEENAFVYHQKEKKRILLIGNNHELKLRNGTTVTTEIGEIIPAGDSIAVFDPFSDPIIAEQDGKVKFNHIISGTTLKEEVNEDTGQMDKKIAEKFEETLEPSIIIKDKNGKEHVYFLPAGAYLNVDEGKKVKAGSVLAKILQEGTKTQDITGGLPRVGELFEARQAKNIAIMASVSGKVEFKNVVKGKRVIVIKDNLGKEHKHLVPVDRHLLVRDGDQVKAAEKLCEGNFDSHEVLRIQGENALQRFLVDGIQEVYRLQGVQINDKHIGIIIRQMMRKVEIIEVGDSPFIYGQQVDKHTFRVTNTKIDKEGGRPAIAKPLLQGITRASLNIDSWISAASFQETTKVLTNAAIGGEMDKLRGLKENVVIGRIIPAGTGIRKYKNLRLYTEDIEDLDEHVRELLQIRRREQELNKAQEEQAVSPVNVVVEEEDASKS